LTTAITNTTPGCRSVEADSQNDTAQAQTACAARNRERVRSDQQVERRSGCQDALERPEAVRAASLST